MSPNALTLWHENVKQDLAAFTDPNTVSEFIFDDEKLAANWTSRRQKHHAVFRILGDGSVQVNFQNSILTYLAFLSSSSMADLDELALMMSGSDKDEIYVNTKATIGDDLENPLSVDTAINDLLSSVYGSSTRILFVTGEAGAGKTQSLRYLVREQANKYRKRETNSLYFYVNAQGRALARLNEALATEIQDLRVTSLTYHAVPALTRNSLLVPIIDGFDELLGVSGYDDAFSSLRRFLEELDGRGQVVASARSAYYEQEFLSRANVSGLAQKNIEVKPVRIQPWSATEINQFVEQRYRLSVGTSISFTDFKGAINSAFGNDANKKLKEKPFFISRVADLVLSGESFDPSNLVDQLVERYIERERTEKLLDRNSQPLLSSKQIRGLISEFSTEMWQQGTRALDVEDIRTLTEIYAEDQSLASDVMKIVAERAPSMAFFSVGIEGRRIQFEHEIFFAYFLSEIVERAWLAGVNTIFDSLVRGQLPEFVSEFVGQRIAGKIEDDQLTLDACVEVLNGANRMKGRDVSQLQGNAGLLLAGTLAICNDTGAARLLGLRFEGFIFAGIALGNLRIEESQFYNSRFFGTDLSETQFIDCSVDNDCRFDDIVVDPNSTRLEFSKMDPRTQVFGLRIRDNNSFKRIFQPNIVSDILQACGANSELQRGPAVNNDILLLMEQLMAKFERTNMFWPDDIPNRGIVGNPNWEILRERLLLFNIVTIDEKRAVSKQPREALRRNFLPQQIMDGLRLSSTGPIEIRQFWESWMNDETT